MFLLIHFFLDGFFSLTGNGESAEARDALDGFRELVCRLPRSQLADAEEGEGLLAAGVGGGPPRWI